MRTLMALMLVWCAVDSSWRIYECFKDYSDCWEYQHTYAGKDGQELACWQGSQWSR